MGKLPEWGARTYTVTWPRLDVGRHGNDIGFSLIIRSSVVGACQAKLSEQDCWRRFAVSKAGHGDNLCTGYARSPQPLGATRGHGNTAQRQRPFVLSPALLEFRHCFQIPRSGTGFKHSFACFGGVFEYPTIACETSCFRSEELDNSLDFYFEGRVQDRYI